MTPLSFRSEGPWHVRIGTETIARKTAHRSRSGFSSLRVPVDPWHWGFSVVIAPLEEVNSIVTDHVNETMLFRNTPDERRGERVSEAQACRVRRMAGQHRFDKFQNPQRLFPAGLALPSDEGLPEIRDERRPPADVGSESRTWPLAKVKLPPQRFNGLRGKFLFLRPRRRAEISLCHSSGESSR